MTFASDDLISHASVAFLAFGGGWASERSDWRVADGAPVSVHGCIYGCPEERYHTGAAEIGCHTPTLSKESGPSLLIHGSNHGYT